MSLPSLFSLFLPRLAGLRIVDAHRSGRTVRITATSTTRTATCPTCAMPSARIHSRYQRCLADTPISAQETLIHLYVRRFFCDQDACRQKIFTEQIPGLIRCIPHLSELLTPLAMALGGRAGARLGGHLVTAVSRMSLLCLIRANAETAHGVPRVLGVDDFALRKGQVYGTLLVDAQPRCPAARRPVRRAHRPGPPGLAGRAPRGRDDLSRPGGRWCPTR